MWTSYEQEPLANVQLLPVSLGLTAIETGRLFPSFDSFSPFYSPEASYEHPDCKRSLYGFGFATIQQDFLCRNETMIESQLLLIK